MSGSLPHDVLIDVLTRLPIKTLIRCACVCKSWYSLVTNPSFITTHLNVSSNNSNDLVLIRSVYGDDANQVNYSLLRCENEVLCDYAKLELPLKTDNNHYLRIMGSCNGLVCLSHDYVLYLWNPSIRKTIALPPLRVNFQSHGAFVHTIGIGYNAQTDDYKVIRIVYLHKTNNFQPPAEIDIFSLSTGTWRNISHLGPPHIINQWALPVYLNGAAHWISYGKRGENFFRLIVSFHMVDEIFGEIMLPGSISGSNHSGLSVLVAKFQESLSLIDCHWRNDTWCIWVMKEYGISDSWTQLFNIHASVGLRSVVGFTKKGEVVLRFYSSTERKGEVLLSLYSNTERKMYLSISGTTFYADAYTESLVLFGTKFGNTGTCTDSPILDGEGNGARKSLKRRANSAHSFMPKHLES
ncbi:F-box protein CPR1-like [Cornus florida]|uniref:F-box protein CPR1-like n=1 Tax=Cornus florida TaxID=4283 RepID=UPI0028996626|nr:F-box protein CPR1-like [Cornus florida]